MKCVWEMTHFCLDTFKVEFLCFYFLSETCNRFRDNKMLNNSKLITTFHLGQLCQVNLDFNNLKVLLILIHPCFCAIKSFSILVQIFVPKSPSQFLFNIAVTLQISANFCIRTWNKSFAQLYYRLMSSWVRKLQ